MVTPNAIGVIPEAWSQWRHQLLEWRWYLGRIETMRLSCTFLPQAPC